MCAPEVRLPVEVAWEPALGRRCCKEDRGPTLTDLSQNMSSKLAILKEDVRCMLPAKLGAVRARWGKPGLQGPGGGNYFLSNSANIFSLDLHRFRTCPESRRLAHHQSPGKGIAKLGLLVGTAATGLQLDAGLSPCRQQCGTAMPLHRK